MTVQAGRLDIRDLILCDDIRMEKDGRHSLMGVYSGAHLIHTDFPHPFQVGIALVVSPISAGMVPIHLEISGTAISKTRKLFGEVGIEYAGAGEHEVHVVPMGVGFLRIEQAGNLIFKVGQYNEEPKTIRIYRLKHRPLAGATSDSFVDGE